MFAEGTAKLRAVAVDFFFNCWISVFVMYQGASVMRKAFDWKRFRISMSEVEAVP
jgi:hypothetical protein